MNNSPLVAIRDLEFAYRRKPVFKGLSLSLQPGFIYGLLGKNGTGKSTLLRNIAGLLFPDKGAIRVMGFEPGKRQPAFLQEMFLLPEEFSLPAISIGQWVRYNSPFYPRFNKAMFDRSIADFAVPTDSKLTEMSYGQQKKALISFALATNSSLLLMDEPTNGLDILSKSQFRKVIAGSLDEGKCIIISTHQVKDLENLIDRVMIIDEGSILFDQRMDVISRKLDFRLSFDPEETAGALYSESSLKGNAIITLNAEGEDSRPDLEMLYKAIMLQGEQFNRLFTGL
jgi:ABC-2 type transport system ATP-binding protein